MEHITVRRYATPVPADSAHPFVGWVEPEDRSWVLFIRRGACPMLFVRLDEPAEDGQTYGPVEAGDLTDSVLTAARPQG